jgi:hypothetical protein
MIHAHLGEDLAIVPLALLAARRHRRPLVLTIHTSVRHTLAVTSARSAVLKMVGGRLERRGEQAADAIIALVPRVAALIRADGIATPIHVVPSGVVPGRLEHDVRPAHDPLAPIPRPRVIFVGRLHRQKHVDVLMRAAAQMPGVSVVLVGDGPERPGLNAGPGSASPGAFTSLASSRMRLPACWAQQTSADARQTRNSARRWSKACRLAADSGVRHGRDPAGHRARATGLLVPRHGGTCRNATRIIHDRTSLPDSATPHPRAASTTGATGPTCPRRVRNGAR